MITLEMLKKGYEQGVVRLIDSPNGDGVVCGIGDNWFYFGGFRTEGVSVEEYCKDIPFEEILDEIFNVLEDFRKEGDVFEDEYLYYEAFLNENLKEVPLGGFREQAQQFVKDNKTLAYEIFRVIDREYYKEDIVGKLEDKGVDVESLTDAEISKMAERFENVLSHNDGYWESYWLSAEAAIEEVLQERSLQEEAGWKTTDEMVDKALSAVSGIGEGEGSGLFGLKDFMNDGERMELLVEICRLEDKEANKEYYGVYYWVGYYGDDSLFTDWEYTSSLDIGELKKLISELEGRDFTEDIRKCIGKGSVETVIEGALGRCSAVENGETRAQDYVKE